MTLRFVQIVPVDSSLIPPVELQRRACEFLADAFPHRSGRWRDQGDIGDVPSVGDIDFNEHPHGPRSRICSSRRTASPGTVMGEDTPRVLFDFPGADPAYRADFETKKDKWIEIEIPLDKFEATSFGRVVQNQPLDPTEVSGLGILLGDKKAGPFKLEVEWIKVKQAE